MIEILVSRGWITTFHINLWNHADALIVAYKLIRLLIEQCVSELIRRVTKSICFFISVLHIKCKGYQVNTSQIHSVETISLIVLEQKFINNFDHTNEIALPNRNKIGWYCEQVASCHPELLKKVSLIKLYLKSVLLGLSTFLVSKLNVWIFSTICKWLKQRVWIFFFEIHKLLVLHIGLIVFGVLPAMIVFGPFIIFSKLFSFSFYLRTFRWLLLDL